MSVANLLCCGWGSRLIQPTLGPYERMVVSQKVGICTFSLVSLCLRRHRWLTRPRAEFIHSTTGRSSYETPYDHDSGVHVGSGVRSS